MDAFTNEAIDVEQLPRLEELNYRGLHPKYLASVLISRTLVMIPLLVMIFVNKYQGNPYFSELLLGLAIVTLLSWLLGLLGFYKKGYALREKDVSYRRGLIFHAITTIPLTRIQHSELIRGPVDRFLGLSSVKIYTAGGSSSDMTIPGLNPDVAEKIRDYINNKIKEDDPS